MPISFATPADIVVFRRNPVRIPTRNFLVVGSDNPVLACTFCQTDSDTAPLDVSDAVFQLNLYCDRDSEHWPWWDYGWSVVPYGAYPITTIMGVPIDPANGRVDFPLAADWNTYYRRRMRFDVAIVYPAEDGIGVIDPNGTVSIPVQGSYTILTGIIEYQRVAALATTAQPWLLSTIGVAT